MEIIGSPTFRTWHFEMTANSNGCLKPQISIIFWSALVVIKRLLCRSEYCAHGRQMRRKLQKLKSHYNCRFARRINSILPAVNSGIHRVGIKHIGSKIYHRSKDMFFLLCLISTFVYYFSKHFQIAVYIDKYGFSRIRIAYDVIPDCVNLLTIQL